ncbi:MAG: hypothetical protein ABJH96_13895, partial [Algoriphagus sp.]
NLSLLYAKVNKSDEALHLMEIAVENPVLAANFSALKTKLGKAELNPELPSDLISQINELAASNALANIPSTALLDGVKRNLQTEDSPMLINAGWRNYFSQKDRNSPTDDLHLLDTLGQKPEMIEYVMALQETAVIRSLAAGRVTEAVKNLNGLAFRNPNDAAYYLQLSGSILAQNLDFQKSANEYIAAEDKGFTGFDTHHWSIFGLAGMPEKSVEIRETYQLELPAYLAQENPAIQAYFNVIGKFHQTAPKNLLSQWRTLAENEMKTDIAIRLIAHKSHGLNQVELESLAAYISDKIGTQEKLNTFVKNPDLKNKESVMALLVWLNASEELTANPYFSPLISSAVAAVTDPLSQYEILNAATEFNQDPILWLMKIKAAKASGLDTYANESLEILKQWVNEEEIETLQNTNY